MDSIRDPEVPFVGRIKGGFKEGKIIRIQGSTPATADRFNINLQTGSETNPRDDVALHLSVRLLEGYVARNSYKNDIWGDEQGHGDLLIAPGQQFEIIVMCGASDFKVAINGQHFCDFPQRISPDEITHLAVDGDVVVTILSFEGGDAHSRSTASSQESGAYGPSAPSQYGGPPQGDYGPPQGQYGPPQGQYGPPQGQYGPAQGGYGPPQGGYGPPQGQYGGYPGGPPGPQEQDSGFDFLGSAGSLIAGAISSGMAEKLIGSLTSGGHSNPEPHHGQQQQSQQHSAPSDPLGIPGFNLSQLAGGGGSAGGLGSIGTLLSGFMEQALHQPNKVATANSVNTNPALPGMYSQMGGIINISLTTSAKSNVPPNKTNYFTTPQITWPNKEPRQTSNSQSISNKSAVFTHSPIPKPNEPIKTWKLQNTPISIGAPEFVPPPNQKPSNSWKSQTLTKNLHTLPNSVVPRSKPIETPKTWSSRPTPRNTFPTKPYFPPNPYQTNPYQSEGAPIFPQRPLTNINKFQPTNYPRMPQIPGTFPQQPVNPPDSLFYPQFQRRSYNTPPGLYSYPHYAAASGRYPVPRGQYTQAGQFPIIRVQCPQQPYTEKEMEEIILKMNNIPQAPDLANNGATIYRSSSDSD